MDFFIADTHFFDSSIIKYENRPFDDANDMLMQISARWNAMVAEADRVFVLGDFLNTSKKADLENCIEVIKNLKGRKYLIKGNHDTENDSFYMECGFEKVYEYPIVIENFWILSHEPMYMNNNMPYANIYGHVHNNDMYKDFSKHSFCVSVERIDYTPISFEAIKKAVVESLE